MSGVTLHYPRASVVGDWLRAGGGLLATAGPLLLVPGMVWPLQLLLAGMAAVFATFGLQTWLRQRLRIRVDEDGFEALPRYGRVRWSEVSGVALAYFSTRRDREGGWFELKVRTPAGNMRVDSRMEGFETLAGAALRAAGEHGLELSPVSLANGRQLGVDTLPGEAA